MTSIALEAYLSRLGRELRKYGLVDTRIVEEAREHLVDAMEEGVQRGLSVDVAECEAFVRFGAPERVAAHFAKEKYRMLNRLLFILASIAGLVRRKAPGAGVYWRVKHIPLWHKPRRIVALTATAAVLLVAALYVLAALHQTDPPQPPSATRSPGLPSPPSGSLVAMSPISICHRLIAPPPAQPPAGSGPIVLALAPCFEGQRATSKIDRMYASYIQLRPSQPANGVWIPYDDAAERVILNDFRRLWDTSELGNLSIDVDNYTFPNGVIGKLVTYHIEERPAGGTQPPENRDGGQGAQF